MPSEVFEFELNGRATEVMARPLATLGHVLREQLQLKATKAGCRQGGCGSCTVMVDG
jgi:aerobic-type carbon monoxide dehydrogenase small subunit (CoxS/CutS family)